MRLVARDFYQANLMELNYGASALSPEGAAYAVNDLVQPALSGKTMEFDGSGKCVTGC
jgi:hypothetical protein